VAEMIALDVGTRSIVCAEHEARAITRLGVSEHALPCMREGTVHDLAAAAESIRALRESMGLAEGTPASVAIAGASLTSRSFPVTLSGPGPWTAQDLDAADAAALAAATNRAPASRARTQRTLLGTTRSGFRHDGRPAGSLIGLEGARAEYRLLATWLPLEIVRVKLRAIEAAGFVPAKITVEPVAVGRALFGLTPPPGVFAVIDIGAGTSDIALIAPEGLSGIASVPVAGDSITQILAKRLGLSYLEADRVKRDPDTPVIDLWGAKKTWSAREIRREAEEGVTALVESLAATLRELSGEGRLDGVILVGGGSLWPDLPERLAAEIEISEERVRVRPSETIPGIADRTGLVKGPAFLTVLGIILSESSAFGVTRCTVNGKEALQVAPAAHDRVLTVADVVEACGENPVEFFGEPGEARVTGDVIVPGEPGGDPVVHLRGVGATLDSAVASGDVIKISKGAAGAAAGAVPLAPVVIPAKAGIQESDQTNDLDSRLRGNDEITRGSAPSPHSAPVPLATLIPLPVDRAIAIRIDGREHFVRDRTRSALVDGLRTRATAAVSSTATISTERSAWRVFEALGGRSTLPDRILINGREAGLLDELRAGDEVVVS
jgi:cell division ATPase FtsA